jgi:Niemann-Pick C2 protein
MKTVLLSLFAACCLCMTVSAVPWKDCGSAASTPSAVSVVGCDDTGVCKLTKGVNASFAVDFTAKEDATGLKMLVYGHIAGIDVPFPISNPDGCKDSNITCPIKKGQSYRYRNAIYVKTEYPSMTLVVKLKLEDQDKNVIFCVTMPVQIVGSQAKRQQLGKSNSIKL